MKLRVLYDFSHGRKQRIPVGGFDSALAGVLEHLVHHELFFDWLSIQDIKITP